MSSTKFTRKTAENNTNNTHAVRRVRAIKTRQRCTLPQSLNIDVHGKYVEGVK